MNKRLCLIVMAGLVAVAVTGCTSRQTFPPAAFQPVEPEGMLHAKKVDTFVVVLDTGSAIERTYRKRLEADRAQEIVSKINRAIPDLDYQAALLTFSSGSCLSCEDAETLYGLGRYKREEFAAALEGYKTTGEAARAKPLSSGAEISRIILRGNPGRLAIILVADSENVLYGRAFKAVQKLQGVLGNRLCIYPVQVDKDCIGRKAMDALVNVGGCGFAVNANDIASPEAMAAYVKEVFLTSGAFQFASATAHKGLDSDGDGVPDGLDKCPNTPKGAKVDTDGCWVLRSVYFETGQSVIKDFIAVNEAVAVLKANPTLNVQVHGHTDSTASSEFNQQLSEDRANAVRDYFINRGLQAGRIQAKGFGETKPVAPNETKDGRALNRRVEFHLHTQ